jgi:hypothetical protein
MSWHRYGSAICAAIALLLGVTVTAAAPETAESLETASNYEAAAAAYEQRANVGPNTPEAPPALYRATVLRLGTGQLDLAKKNAATYESRYGNTQPTHSAELFFGLALVLAEGGHWRDARVQLDQSRARWEKAPLDTKLGALTLHARALQRDGGAAEQTRAQAEFQTVRSAWSNPAAAEAELRRARPDEEEGLATRRLGRVLTAVGEAMFEDAEAKRRQALSPLPAPKYAGPADEDKFLEFQRTTVRVWQEKKRAALQQAETNYVAVLDLKPFPPPKWVVASASQVARMWADLADEVETASMPPATPAMAALRRKLEPVARAVEDDARDRYTRPRMRKCVELSAKLQYTSSYAESCRAWLDAHDPEHTTPPDELAPKVAVPKPGP